MRARILAATLASSLVTMATVAGATDTPSVFKLVRVDPPSEPNAVPIYSGAAPGSEDARQIERWGRLPDGNVIARNVKEAGPLFIGVALDDFPFGHQGFGLVESWQKIGRPVELHAYEKGGHGFGTGRQGTTTMMVMDEFLLWLKTRGLLDKSKPQ